jgi:broad specificity phosphatase PhoE
MFAHSPHELPLTELGYTQAHSAARRIGESFRPSLVVSSEFLRASETARVIAETLGVPLSVEPNLHEREVGAHRGLPYDSLAQAPDYDSLHPWAWKPEGGESFEEVQARAAPVMDRLAATHPHDDIVLVSHGGVMVALWAHAAADWVGAYKPPNCGIVLIEHGPTGYALPHAIDAQVGATDSGG